MVEWLPPLSEKQKRNLVILAVVFCLGALILGASYLIPPASGGKASRDSKEDESVPALERRLSEVAQDILSKVQGVGKVAVRVTLGSGPTTEYARNEMSTERQTEERAEPGTTRKINEGNQNTQLAIARSGSAGEQPLVVKVKQPEVLGVLVVAEGAEDPYVRSRLYEACEVLFNLTADRISVLPMKKGGR